MIVTIASKALILTVIILTNHVLAVAVKVVAHVLCRGPLAEYGFAHVLALLVA